MAQEKPQLHYPSKANNKVGSVVPFELLKFIYLNIIDQQKYAENKNAAILVLNSAILIGYLTLLPYSLNDCPIYILLYSISFVLLGILAILASLFSFLPILSNKIENQQTQDSDFNIFFFMHLAKFTARDLLVKIYGNLNLPQPSEGDPLCMQIANQIVINSCIARRKHKLFGVSLWLSIFGIVTPIVGGIILLIYTISQARHN